MNLIHFIHVSMLSTVLCEIQRFQDGTFIADFIVVNKGRVLYPSIVMFIEDLTRNECTEYCIKHLDCVTFNYNLRTRACELVDQNFDEYEALVDDSNWYNYGTPDKVDGKWTYWMNTSCSVTCGNGTLTQYRTCSIPEPKYGGAPCDGNEAQTVRCNTGPCPIDGGWSSWTTSSSCSANCGYGTMKQQRTCTAPVPKYDGEPCIGNKVQTVSCNIGPCPIDGGWTQWTRSSCSLTCGTGTMRRQRTCTSPEPKYGGTSCIGFYTQTLDCYVQKSCVPTCVKTTLGGCCKFPYGHNGKLHHQCWSWNGKYVCYDTAGGFRTCAKHLINGHITKC